MDFEKFDSYFVKKDKKEILNKVDNEKLKLLNDIVSEIVNINNNPLIKEYYKYMPHYDFHTGIDSNNYLSGKTQLKNSILFNILRDFPKGAEHHAHLFAYLNIEKTIDFILKNENNWDDKLWVCIDISSKYYMSCFLLPEDQNQWIKVDTDAVKNTESIFDMYDEYFGPVPKNDNTFHFDIAKNKQEYLVTRREQMEFIKKSYVRASMYNNYPNMYENIQGALEFGSVLYNNELIRSHKHNLMPPTKWDLLNLVTERTGSMVKHWKVFPWFFANYLYDAAAQNILISEIRLPLNSIYSNRTRASNFIEYKKDKLSPIEQTILMENIWTYCHNNPKDKHNHAYILNNNLADIQFYTDIIQKNNSTLVLSTEPFVPYYKLIGGTGKGSIFKSIKGACDNINNTIIITFHAKLKLIQMLKKVNDNSRGFYERLSKRIIGYDIYGEEDMSNGTYKYEKLLVEIKNYANKKNIQWNYYLHSGENYSIYKTNKNLLTSFQTGAKRIGHGIRLGQNPYLIELIKNKDICIEVCPISNQLLEYIQNISFHPAKSYYNSDVPISISSDDRNLYGYDDITYDWTAFVYSLNLSLYDVYHIAKNTILYSSFTDDEVATMLNIYNKKFFDWINKTLQSIKHGGNYLTDDKRNLLNFGLILSNQQEIDSVTYNNYKKYLIDKVQNVDVGTVFKLNEVCQFNIDTNKLHDGCVFNGLDNPVCKLYK